ncbi:ABC transporter permease [Paenibacillus qinlingensis]|uniref:Peptide/nickel transport system permease protein n=1 Tax=Paenibacillus qinlingensis TaxID=1837343 RepID=A0ABU1P4X1_9BACL|nr:ABC transporter permease [Paenibacillus qinlingensis]MDR6554795.1 peptide/nickel transport system permease protein [Paenibacillus qinlingensis]
MTGHTAATESLLVDRLGNLFFKMLLHPTYRFLLLLVGAPLHLIVYSVYLYSKKHSMHKVELDKLEQQWTSSGYRDRLFEETKEQLERKHRFFGQTVAPEKLEREANQITAIKFKEALLSQLEAAQEGNNRSKVTYADTFSQLIRNPAFLALSIIPGVLMYVLMFVYSNAYLKYIMERLVMTVFVIFGVAFLVFTILYLSPMNPAANIIGETATAEQIASFNKLYGLDQPYLVQLWDTFRGIITFDLGKSFAGNEVVTTSIAAKFPVTLTLTVISTIIAVLIALPIGLISATRPNSFVDYTFMLIALIGLSIPNFWQGLVLILNFSIKLHWLPATYNPQNALSMIMPIIVLGTGLTAAVARMTRSSTLEVIHEDYIITARAKGLSRRQVLWKHAVGNALIPIITVIGLQFGGMLGGAAVTEKVFNINGIGSYIVDKQFIPDIPAIMGGVVYTAITISIVNVIIDILYAFFDPRIRSKMKQY